MSLGRRKVNPGTVRVGKKAIPGPETSSWYFNPNRIGALEAPLSFRERLREVDPDGLIDIRWHPINERWHVFYRKPGFTHKICSGWVLLFIVQYGDGSYMPLDERTLARLYSASAAKWGDGKQYWLAIQREFEREQERKERNANQQAVDAAMPYFEYSKIKNIGSGSKFAEYLS